MMGMTGGFILVLLGSLRLGAEFRKIDCRFDDVDKEFKKIDGRLDGLQQAVNHLKYAVTGSLQRSGV
jgi:hypothetical protein